MGKLGMTIIVCPRERCDNCVDNMDSTCSKLVQNSGSTIEKKLMLIEVERGFIHITNSSGRILEPPWISEGWDSVFCGKQIDILLESETVLDASIIGPYLSIFTRETNTSSIFQRTLPLVRSHLEASLLDDLIRKSSLLFKEKSISRANFTKRLEKKTLLVFEYLSEFLPEINMITRSRMAEIVAHRASVLCDFIPLLLDDDVEEIYLDRPMSPVYFDHHRFGRCLCDFTITSDDVLRIVTLLRSESNLHLDRRNPSLKTDFRVYNVLLRFSATLPPLSPDGLHLEIRRASTKPFTLLDLIRNETLPLEVAALLLLAANSRFNITITGEPGAGKTTLLNALDLATPSIWRKIYIEDAIESRILEGHHQVRIRVNPVDERDESFSKSEEIIKSLHRSPDYLILGEIQTKSHIQALFQAMSAGLRTIQTCHSGSASGLVSRWTHNQDIETSSLALMDLVVTVFKPIPGSSIRHVREIVEVRKRVSNGIFEFEGLNVLYDYYHSKTFGNWSDDGAFKFRANEMGIDNPDNAYKAVIGLVTEILGNNQEDSLLYQKLWEKGHPMKFAFNSSVS